MQRILMHDSRWVENNVRGYCFRVSLFLKLMYAYILEASYHSYSTPEENLTQSSLAEFVLYCFICHTKGKKSDQEKQTRLKKGSKIN